jgi:hypothetical protein
MAWLRLTLQGNAMTSSLITPAVTVNGYRVVAHYGENLVPVWAGPNRVDVSCQWLIRFGEATLQLQVPPSAQVPVFYAAPWHQFSTGAIGCERQKRPGVLGLVMLLALVLLVLSGISVLLALAQ